MGLWGGLVKTMLQQTSLVLWLQDQGLSCLSLVVGLSLIGRIPSRPMIYLWELRTSNLGLHTTRSCTLMQLGRTLLLMSVFLLCHPSHARPCINWNKKEAGIDVRMGTQQKFRFLASILHVTQTFHFTSLHFSDMDMDTFWHFILNRNRFIFTE